jgi:hypothetical protein
VSQLFVVVAKNTRTGVLYISDHAELREGTPEYSVAKGKADELQQEEGSHSGWEFVVGRVTEVVPE